MAEETKIEPDIQAAPEKKPKQAEMISKAIEAAERLEKANIVHRELLDREESIRVENTLGGKADAGIPNKEETPKEYKDRVMRNEL